MIENINYLANRPNLIRDNSNYLLSKISPELRKLCKDWDINLMFVEYFPNSLFISSMCFNYHPIRDICLFGEDIRMLRNILNCSLEETANITTMHELGHMILYSLKAKQTEKAAWLQGSRLLNLTNVSQDLYLQAIKTYVNI
jgi:hypothetical protein